MNTQEELLKRYIYLYDNKELILANCIIYDVEEEYLKQQLKKIKAHMKKIKRLESDQRMFELSKYMIARYQKDLKITKAYLSASPKEEYLDMLEEFILGDNAVEDTELYLKIETIKKKETELNKYSKMIDDLIERRSKNMHLKKIPTFTVWKILTYVRKLYPNNAIVLSALDKYYNLDRYTLANDDSTYGYYVKDAEEINPNYPDSTLYGRTPDGFIAFGCRVNEFEEEDDYHDIKSNIELDDNFYPKRFANELANLSINQIEKEKLKIYLKK